jgi:hypothetical protein
VSGDVTAKVAGNSKFDSYKKVAVCLRNVDFVFVSKPVFKPKLSKTFTKTSFWRDICRNLAETEGQILGHFVKMLSPLLSE